MKKLAFFLIVLSCIFVSCSESTPLDSLPFIVTGIEPIKNSNMCNYYQLNQNMFNAKHFVLAPVGKFQIGDTISAAYFY